MLQDPGILYIADYDSDLGRDYACGARLRDGHHIGAFAGPQDTQTEFLRARHAF